MKKTIIGATLVVATTIFTGCGSTQPTLSQTAKASYKINMGMSKAEVTKILKLEPTEVQRIDNYEIWKYEGIDTNEDTKESKYIDLIIKFKNGKVTNIGTFSCKIPKKEGE